MGDPVVTLAPAPAPEPEPTPAPTRSADDDFRPDVEGLRGIAIVLVLLFHGTLPLPGGFIGVDVFFVISGFLITGMLLRELGRNGRIDLGRFYARRIRRLLPAAAVTLAVTLPLAYLAIAPIDRDAVMRDGAAAMLSVANVRFALTMGDYFSAVGDPSPFLHFWSLSVEEQFYLVWPFLLLAVARGRHPRLAAGIVLALLLGVSLGASLLLTATAEPWAFYSLPSRAWQFAAGGLLAIGAAHLARVPWPLVAGAGWAAIVALGAGAILIDGSVPYPGVAVLIPTLATAALIASGDRRGGPGRLLATRPLRFLGRISYSLYLWHWPLLVLPVAALEAPLSPALALALIAVAVVVAWISHEQVEQRFRRSTTRSRGGLRRAYLGGAMAAALVVAMAGALDVAAIRALADLTSPPVIAADPVPGATDGPDAGLDAGPVVGPDGSAEPSPEASATPRPAASPSTPPGTDPRAEPSPSPSPSPVPALIGFRDIPETAPPKPIPLPKDVKPSLAGARTDIERLYADGCITQASGTKPVRCVYGDPKGAITIALVGDSHASHWFPAFNVLANTHGWRLVPYVKVSCPFVDMRVRNLSIDREYPECATWRARVIAELNRRPPDLVVVVSGHRAIIAVRSADATPRAQGLAMAREIAKLDAPVAVMVDTPRVSNDIPACLSRHSRDIRACAIDRALAFPAQFGLREELAARTSGAALVDLVAAVCPATPCQVVQDGKIVYRDGHHLTATFVRSLSDDLHAQIEPLVVATSGVGPSPAPSASAPAPASSPSAPAPSASAPAPAPSASATPGPPASPRPAGRLSVVSERLAAGGGTRGGGALEPVVATHPTDPAVMAIAYERDGSTPGSGRQALAAAIATSRDGGITWRDTPARPWDRSGRASSAHSAVAWGPGPGRAARLYWAGTIAGVDGVRVAIATSDDLGATWSRLYVVRDTPAWVGGIPDITVDRDPASPNVGVAYVVYPFAARGGAGSGLRLLASADHGRTWHGVDVAKADPPTGFGRAWRFAYRVRSAPDGSVVVSAYQADLRRWDPGDVFDRGGAANVGRIAITVTRVRFDRAGGTFAAGPTTVATILERNGFSTARLVAPGTRSHTYLDPMWSHGLALDPDTGRIVLAVGEVRAAPPSGEPRGIVRLGRSDDGGRSWAWTTVPVAAPADGTRQSSFRPTVAVVRGMIVVGLHTIDDVALSRAWRTDATLGTAISVSFDGGASFAAPQPVTASRWRASALQAAVNGPGLRDRIDVAADGRLVYVFADARRAAPMPSRAASRRLVHAIVLEVIRPARPAPPRAIPA